MRDKYSGLQIGIHWLFFLLVVVAYAAMELRGFFPRSERPLINMVHVSCGITIFVLMVARLLVRLKSPAPPIVPKPSPMMITVIQMACSCAEDAERRRKCAFPRNFSADTRQSCRFPASA